MSDWPDNLPGLNLKQALSQLGGKKALYIKLLGMFEGAHTGDVDRIIEAANAQDWTAVHDINHALKGVSGNLAADELFALCSALDQKVKEDNHDIQDELAAMPLAMSTLLDSVAQAKTLPVD